MNTDPRLTEERLRTWLDGNQPARERLCVQILALDRRFKNVRPRQPKGGPDGGYDLEAITGADTRVVGAIGFRNSPADSGADQRWVKDKFKTDLANALRKAGPFGTLVFLTNVRLSVGQRQKLLTLGRTLTDIPIEIVDREQMRVALDSPEGLAARYQFLQISLSEAEQAAFFARWGADLESLVSTSFAAVDERLHRLEFLHERDRTLAAFGFQIRLLRPTPIAELNHVRAYLSLAKFGLDADRSNWQIGVCNNSGERAAPGCGSANCLASGFWLLHETQLQGTAAARWPDPFTTVGATGGFNAFSRPEVVAKLGDIDDAYFAFFMNKRLFAAVHSIRIFANEYLVWSAAADQLRADKPNQEPKTPWVFTPSELTDQWVRVLPKGYSGHIQFSSLTPRRMWSAPTVDGSV